MMKQVDIEKVIQKLDDLSKVARNSFREVHCDRKEYFLGKEMGFRIAKALLEGKDEHGHEIQ